MLLPRLPFGPIVDSKHTTHFAKDNLMNFNNLQWKFLQFMQGRNGMDTCARWSLGASIVCIVLDFIIGSFILSLLGWVFLLYSIFRCYSRNIPARALENAKFEHAMREPRQKFAELDKKWTNRKTTKYFKCPQCGQSLSVPKGKGTLRVSCPKCHAQTTVKS